VWLLQLIVPLLRLLFVLLGVLGRRLFRRCSTAALHLLLLRHVNLGLPVDSIDYDVVVVQVALNHLDLRVRLVQFLVVAVAAENDDLKVLGKITEAVDGADADPHVVHRLLSAVELVAVVVVVRGRVGLLLEVLARHDVVLLR